MDGDHHVIMMKRSDLLNFIQKISCFFNTNGRKILSMVLDRRSVGESIPDTMGLPGAENGCPKFEKCTRRRNQV